MWLQISKRQKKLKRGKTKVRPRRWSY